MIKRLLSWMLICVSCMICVSGCQSAEAEAEPEDSSVQSEQTVEDSTTAEENSQAALIEVKTEEALEPVEGGELRLAIENPESLLPWNVTDEATGNMLMLIYSPLMNQKEDGTMLPCLAASKSWSQDQTELTIKLKADVTFHNGKKLTAEDVVYSIKMLQSSQNVYAQTVSRIAQADVTEEGELILRFSAPGRMNEEGLIFPVVPDGYEEKLVPIGTGPYAYEKAETMREMQLKRYEDYFDEKPWIEAVKVYFVRDAAAVEQCFETSRTNLMQTDYFVWGTYVNQKNLTVHAFDSYEAVYLEFNTKGTYGSVYSNREKAVLAVDAVRVLRDAYWGKGVVTETLLRPGSWYKEEETRNFGYDAEKAASMIAVGSGKVRLLYDDADPVVMAAAETIRIQLEAAGLTVQMKTSGSYDIALRREKMTLMKAAELVSQQDLLAQAESEEEIRMAASQLDLEMNENLIVYNLFFLTQASVTGYGIEGELTPGDWNVYAGIEQLYMQTVEEEAEGGADQ